MDYTSHYQVKFQRGGVTIYGIAKAFEARRKGLEAKGEIIVEDAILPTSYIVRVADLTDIPLGTKENNYQSELDLVVSKAFAEAEENDRKQGEGLHVGSMFQVGVADGSAHYVVTALTASKCKVEWRGFCPDRWTDHHFGWGGSFPRKDIERYVGRNQARQRLPRL